MPILPIESVVSHHRERRTKKRKTEEGEEKVIGVHVVPAEKGASGAFFVRSMETCRKDLSFRKGEDRESDLSVLTQ